MCVPESQSLNPTTKTPPLHRYSMKTNQAFLVQDDENDFSSFSFKRTKITLFLMKKSKS